MLHGELVVRARSLKQLVEEAGSAFGGRLPSLAFDRGHEGGLAPLLALLLLLLAVGGAFVGVLLSLRLAFGTIEDRSNRLFTRSVASGDVELFRGSWTSAP